MKNVLKLTLAVICLVSAQSLFAQKLGRINTYDVISAMPEFKEMQTNLEAYAKELQEHAEAMQVEFNTKLQEYQKSYETYSEAIRDMKSKELESLRNRISDFEQTAQQDMQRKQNELFTPIQEKAKNAIDKVSAAGNYVAVFETGSLVYYDATNLIDIAPEVLKELGI